MYYVNLSRNGHVTKEGLHYTCVYLEGKSTSFEEVQIPFVGFLNSDFLELPSGTLIMLAPFDVVFADGHLVLVKGYDTKNMIMVMYSIPWHQDGILREIIGGRPPETVFRFKTGHVSDTYYHEYLLFLHRGFEYLFGYYSESSKSAFVVSMFWGKGEDDLVVRYFNPRDYF
jgi:hypothetical protein